MKSKLQITLAVAIACACLSPLTSHAITITNLSFSQAIGKALPGPTPANAGADQNAVNAVIWRINGGVGASPYDDAAFSYIVGPAASTPPIDYAIWGASGSTTGNDQQADLGKGFRYLAVKFDGSDGSFWIWDLVALGNLSDGEHIASIQSPDIVGGKEIKPNNFDLFNPAVGINPTVIIPTPDSGATVILLGVALAGLSLFRRRMSA